MTDSQAAAPAIEPKSRPTTPPAKKRPGGFGRWYRKHRGKIGALILLATFVIKDAWKEHLKDLVDSLDKTESIYLVREDVAELRPDVQELTNHLELLMSDRQKANIYDLGIEASRRLVRGAKVINQNDSLVLANSEQLLERMPASAQQQSHSDLDSIKRKQEELERQFREWGEVYLS